MHIEFSPVNLLMNHLLVYFPLSLINSLNSSVLMFLIGSCSEGQNTSHWALIISVLPLPLGSKSVISGRKVCSCVYFFLR